MSSIRSDFIKYFNEVHWSSSSDEEGPPLQEACKKGDLKLIEQLLKDPKINPADENSNALHLACEFGYLDIVNLLLTDGRADPSNEDNLSIQMAAYNGHLQVVKALLKDPRVDSSANNYFAIKKAHERGHKKVVEVLLPKYEQQVYEKKKSSYNVMPSEASDLMELAFKTQHPEIVTRLFENGLDPFAGMSVIVGSCGEVQKLVESGYDASKCDNPTFKLFCKYDRLEFVEMSLTRPRVYHTRNIRLREAIQQGNLEHLDEILNKNSEDPATNGSESILLACVLGNLEIVKRLLADGRANPAINGNLCLRLATWKNYLEIVKELLNDSRVKDQS